MSSAAAFLLTWPAFGHDPNVPEIGVVYYNDGHDFKPLIKETAPQGGRHNYAAKVKSAHASIRLPTDGLQKFEVCGVDPSRYKLYKFKSQGNARTVTIAKINIWVGGSKSTLSESEVPVTIQSGDHGCFTIEPKQPLVDGQYGFSPARAEDVFMFGVGAPR